MSRPCDFGDGWDFAHAPLAMRLLMVPIVVAMAFTTAFIRAVCAARRQNRGEKAIAYALEERALRKAPEAPRVESQPPTLVSLEDQAVLISRDVRPAAMEAVQDRYVSEARRVAERHGLCALIEDLGDGWKEVWLYKHPHVGFVIEKTGRQAATAFDHWVLGKLFGYSEDVIADYLLRLGLSADLDEARPLAARALRKGKEVDL